MEVQSSHAVHEFYAPGSRQHTSQQSYVRYPAYHDYHTALDMELERSPRLYEDLIHVRQPSRGGLRSRNGVVSSASSIYSQASTAVDVPNISRQSSRNDLASLAASQASGTESTNWRLKPSSLLARQKRVKRQDSQTSLRTAGMSSVEESERRFGGARQFLSLGLSRSKKEESRQVPPVRPIISNPFDFQHVTHTDRKQLAGLKSPQDLGDVVADFMSLQVSPKSPKPKAEAITALTINSPTQELSPLSKPPPEKALPDLPSPQPTEIPSDPQLQTSPASLTSNHKVHHVRSAESFSKPRLPQQASARLSLAMASPPPRLSSRAAVTTTTSDDSGVPETSQSSSQHISGEWNFSDDKSILSTKAVDRDSAVVEGESGFSHAMTTPGDAAVPVVESPQSPVEVLERVLEDVAEEGTQEAAKEPEIRSTTVTSTLPVPIPTTNHGTHLSPNSASPRSPRFPRNSFQNSMRARNRPTSQMSDTLTPAFSPMTREFPPTPLHQQDFGLAQDFDTWEEDVDYCYDLEAESHDYEWGRKSSDVQNKSRTEPGANRDSRLSDILFEVDEPLEDFQHPIRRAPRPKLLVPALDAVPDLGPRSAQSASTSQGIRTPSDSFQSAGTDPAQVPPHLQEYFKAQPKYQAIHENTFEDFVANYQEPDRHYPTLETTRRPPSSIYSAATRLSKCSSFETSSVTTGASSHSSIRGNDSSTGSLLDLASGHQQSKSKRHTKNLTFLTINTEQANEHVAKTPPWLDNSAPQKSTGLDVPEAAEEHVPTTPSWLADASNSQSSSISDQTVQDANEQDKLQQPQVIPEPVSPAVSHHERAASDSAAKVLFGKVEPANRRARSATTTNPGNKSPLSLFPNSTRHT